MLGEPLTLPVPPMYLYVIGLQHMGNLHTVSQAGESYSLPCNATSILFTSV